MEVQAHTTPESRRALRTYLRQRRLTASLHQTITLQALNDLEEALLLLRGVLQAPEGCREAAEAYLAKRVPAAARPQGAPGH